MPPKTTYRNFHYKARTTWMSGWLGDISAKHKPDIKTGSPPEFAGTAEVWAPEELLVSAVNTCLMLTFLKMAKASGVTPQSYDSDADGLLENVDGVYAITAITVRPRVVLKSNAEAELARATMAGVEARCFMAQSVKAKVSVEPDFSVG